MTQITELNDNVTTEPHSLLLSEIQKKDLNTKAMSICPAGNVYFVVY